MAATEPPPQLHSSVLRQPPPGPREQILGSVALVLASISLLLIVAEVVLTISGIATTYPKRTFDPLEKMLRYDENTTREGIYTIGWDGSQRGHWRVNRQGWISSIDYDEGRTGGVAVIGDSYIEALGLDHDLTLPGLLRESLGDATPVYSFAMGGSSLTQYLHMARYARRHYDPNTFIINVVHNDFDEMFLADSRAAGMLVFDDYFQECLVPTRTASAFCNVTRKSALLRYILFNCKALEVSMHVLYGIKNKDVDLPLSPNQTQHIVKGVSSVMHKLKSELPGKNIIFTMDADRMSIYSKRIESSLTWLHKLMHKNCKENDFSFIDFTECFSASYAADGKRFEYANDWHWNRHGHRVAFELLASRLKDVLH